MASRQRQVALFTGSNGWTNFFFISSKGEPESWNIFVPAAQFPAYFLFMWIGGIFDTERGSRIFFHIPKDGSVLFISVKGEGPEKIDEARHE